MASHPFIIEKEKMAPLKEKMLVCELMAYHTVLTLA